MASARTAAVDGALWRRVAGVVKHVFTHFPLELTVYMATVPASAVAPKGTRWTQISELPGEALPNVMRKVLAHGLGDDHSRKKLTSP